MQINTKTVVKMMKIKLLLQTMARADFDNNNGSDDENPLRMTMHMNMKTVLKIRKMKIVMNLRKMKKLMNSMHSLH